MRPASPRASILTCRWSRSTAYVAQLRYELEDDPARPKHLLTETGVGYRFKVDG